MNEHPKELIVMIGLPGSGKTTYVNNILKTSTYQLICRDDIRLALGTVFDVKLESFVKSIAETMLRAFLERGLPIIIDETNLSEKLLLKYYSESTKYGYKVIGIFIDTPVEVCRQRRASDHFPLYVIDKMNESLNKLKENNDLELFFHKLYRITPDIFWRILP